MMNLIAKFSFLCLFIGLMASPVVARTPAAASISWSLSKQDDGIKVYVRDVAGSKVKNFRGVITLPTRLSSVVAAIDDTQAYPRLFHHCKSATVLKQVSEREAYRYIITQMPWPVKNRDSIVHSVLRQEPSSKKITITLDARPAMVAPSKGMVRVRAMSGSWELVPNKTGEVTVTYTLSVAPGGDIPVWLVNSLAVDFPFYTLKKLRQAVKHAPYQSAKLAYIVD